MMNRHSTNPWARLRVLLMLPAVALSVIFASACKQDATEDINQPVKTESAISEKEIVIEMEPEETPDDVFMVVEEMPEFPGGTMALLEYLRANIAYPQECKENKIQGRVLVSFIVGMDGGIINPKVVKGVDPALDAVALKVVSGMPNWKPGIQGGVPVRVQYTVPINFRLDSEEE